MIAATGLLMAAQRLTCRREWRVAHGLWPKVGSAFGPGARRGHQRPHRSGDGGRGARPGAHAISRLLARLSRLGTRVRLAAPCDVREEEILRRGLVTSHIGSAR